MLSVTVYREWEREIERGHCLYCNRLVAKKGSKRSLPLCPHHCNPNIVISCSLWAAVVFPRFGFSTLTSCVLFHFLFSMLNQTTRLWPSIVKRIIFPSPSTRRGIGGVDGTNTSQVFGWPRIPPLSSTAQAVVVGPSALGVAKYNGVRGGRHEKHRESGSGLEGPTRRRWYWCARLYGMVPTSCNQLLHKDGY